jgi:hypothetical protein
LVGFCVLRPSLCRNALLITISWWLPFHDDLSYECIARSIFYLFFWTMLFYFYGGPLVALTRFSVGVLFSFVCWRWT